MKPIKDDKEMKKYIKPATGIVDVEMTSMFMDTTSLKATGTDYDSGYDIRTKEEKDWNDGSF